MEQILWALCGVAIVVGGALAGRSRWAMYVGRGAVGVLFLIGGALVNATYLTFGDDYGVFADDAHFWWVTDAWRAIVAPNQVLFIGLLVAFEAIVGVLVLSGGRRTQLGLVGVIAFHLALWVFGWFTTVWSVVVLPPMVLLLRAERRASTAKPEPGRVEERPLAGVGG